MRKAHTLMRTVYVLSAVYGHATKCVYLNVCVFGANTQTNVHNRVSANGSILHPLPTIRS